MNREHKLPLFRSCFAGIVRRGSCWLMLVGGAVFIWLGPLLTPWEENAPILQPARAQAAWLYAWLMLLTWLPFQGAALGRRLSGDGQLEFFRARGKSAASLWMQAGGSVLVWALLVVLLACFICLWPCLPGNPAEAWLWAALVAQFTVLYLLLAVPLVLLAVAIATRASEVTAFIVPAGILFLGLVIAPLIEPLMAANDLAWVRSAWLLVPHAHLADLTPRLVFKMGPLRGGDFLASSACLALQGGALILLGRCVLHTRS